MTRSAEALGVLVQAILFTELHVTAVCSCIANYIILCVPFNSFIK